MTALVTNSFSLHPVILTQSPAGGFFGPTESQLALAGQILARLPAIPENLADARASVAIPAAPAAVAFGRHALLTAARAIGRTDEDARAFFDIIEIIRGADTTEDLMDDLSALKKSAEKRLALKLKSCIEGRISIMRLPDDVRRAFELFMRREVARIRCFVPWRLNSFVPNVPRGQVEYLEALLDLRRFNEIQRAVRIDLLLEMLGKDECDLPLVKSAKVLRGARRGGSPTRIGDITDYFDVRAMVRDGLAGDLWSPPENGRRARTPRIFRETVSDAMGRFERIKSSLSITGDEFRESLEQVVFGNKPLEFITPEGGIRAAISGHMKAVISKAEALYPRLKRLEYNPFTGEYIADNDLSTKYRAARMLLLWKSSRAPFSRPSFAEEDGIMAVARAINPGKQVGSFEMAVRMIRNSAEDDTARFARALARMSPTLKLRALDAYFWNRFRVQFVNPALALRVMSAFALSGVYRELRVDVKLDERGRSVAYFVCGTASTVVNEYCDLCGAENWMVAHSHPDAYEEIDGSVVIGRMKTVDESPLIFSEDDMYLFLSERYNIARLNKRRLSPAGLPGGRASYSSWLFGGDGMVKISIAAGGRENRPRITVESSSRKVSRAKLITCQHKNRLELERDPWLTDRLAGFVIEESATSVKRMREELDEFTDMLE